MRVKHTGKDGKMHTGTVLQFLARDTAHRPYAGAQAIVLRDDSRLVTLTIGADRADPSPYEETYPIEVLPEPTAPQYDPTTGGMPS